MSASDYREITSSVNEGGDGLYSRVELYCEDGTDTEELDKDLRLWASVYGSITVKNTHAAAENRIEKAQHGPQMLAVLGVLTAVAAPLIWAFSETVFYGKRRDEFLLLAWLGGSGRDVRRIHLADAGLFALMSAVFTGVFTLIGIRAAYRIANFTSGTSVYHVFRFPAALYLTAVLLAAIGSAAAVIVSYINLERSSAAGDLTDDN